MQQGCSLDEAFGSTAIGMDLSKDIEAAMNRTAHPQPAPQRQSQEFTLGTDFTKQGLQWQTQLPAQPWAFSLAPQPTPPPRQQKEPMTMERVCSMLADIIQRLDEIQTPRPKPTHQATDVIMFLMVGLFLIFTIDACAR